jgi:hypothetical protein
MEHRDTEIEQHEIGGRPIPDCENLVEISRQENNPIPERLKASPRLALDSGIGVDTPIRKIGVSSEERLRVPSLAQGAIDHESMGSGGNEERENLLEHDRSVNELRHGFPDALERQSSQFFGRGEKLRLVFLEILPICVAIPYLYVFGDAQDDTFLVEMRELAQALRYCYTAQLVHLDFLRGSQDAALDETSPRREKAGLLHEFSRKGVPLFRREEPQTVIHSLREDERTPGKFAAELCGERESSFFVQGVPELAG